MLGLDLTRELMCGRKLGRRKACGSYADVYRERLFDGTLVAVKCARFANGSSSKRMIKAQKVRSSYARIMYL